jgi:hypothetical protein
VKKTAEDGYAMASETKVMLEYRPEIGDLYRYNISIKLQQTISENENAHNNEYSVEMVIAQKILDLAGDGSFHAEFIFESGSLQREDSVKTLPSAGKNFFVIMKKTGEIVSSTLPMPFQTPTFPDRALSINDSWKAQGQMTLPPGITFAQSGKDGLLPVPFEYSIERITRMAGTDCVVIKSVCPDTHFTVEPDFEQDIKATGKVYFAHKEGRLIGFNNENRNIITKGEMMVSSTFTSKMHLL